MSTTKTRKRSGISADRAYRLQADAKLRIADVYSAARSFMSTSEDISARVREVFSSLESKRVPYHVIAYLRGFSEARRDELYRHYIVWTMHVDGALYTSQEMRDLDASERVAGLDKSPEYRSPWGRCNSEQSRHVWTDQKGNVRKDKPFDARHLAEK